MYCRLWKLVIPVALTLPIAGAIGGEPTLVLENARVIVGNGIVMESAEIVISGERIQSVSEASPKLDAVERLDVCKMTVMPGLIDTHVHVLMPAGIQGEEAYREYLRETVPRNLKEFLRHGVTTVKSIGDPEDLILGLRGKVNKGVVSGPRLLAVGPGFSSPGGHPSITMCRNDPWARSQLCVEVEDEEVARAAVRRLAGLEVNAIKAVYHGGAAAPPFPAMRQLRGDVLRAIIDESHRHGLRVTVHTWREKDAIKAVELGADGVEHGAPETPLNGNHLARVLCEQKAFYVPTLQALDVPWFDKNILEDAMHNLKQLADQGVQIAVGTDTFGNFPPGLSTIRELEHMADAGLTQSQIIQAATCNAAEHLGLLEDLGTIEPGKYADMIIIDGDPLEDISAIRKIEVVIKGGNILRFEADQEGAGQTPSDTSSSLRQ